MLEGAKPLHENQPIVVGQRAERGITEVRSRRLRGVRNWELDELVFAAKRATFKLVERRDIPPKVF
jgi:hypothetical protein